MFDYEQYIELGGLGSWAKSEIRNDCAKLNREQLTEAIVDIIEHACELERENEDAKELSRLIKQIVVF